LSKKLNTAPAPLLKVVYGGPTTILFKDSIQRTSNYLIRGTLCACNDTNKGKEPLSGEKLPNIMKCIIE